MILNFSFAKRIITSYYVEIISDYDIPKVLTSVVLWESHVKPKSVTTESSLIVVSKITSSKLSSGLPQERAYTVYFEAS